MARNKGTGDHSGRQDDIEPMWVSPDAAEDDWDDSFGNAPSASNAGFDDDFASKDDQTASAQRNVQSSDDVFDDFDQDFDTDTASNYDSDEMSMSEDDQPTSSKQSKRTKMPGNLNMGSSNSKMMSYGIMGVFGLVVVLIGYNMVFGGAKKQVVAANTPAPVASMAQPKPVPVETTQPAGAIKSVDLQQTPDAVPVPTANESTPNQGAVQPSSQASQTAINGAVAAPIGGVPEAGQGIADFSSIASQASNPPPALAGDLSLPPAMGAAGDPGAMTINGGMPTAQINADTSRIPSADPQSGMSDSQKVEQLGDRLIAEFRNDMTKFKSEVNDTVKETIQDDMSMLRAQVEGLNRRVESIENGKSIKPLEETVKPATKKTSVTDKADPSLDMSAITDQENGPQNNETSAAASSAKPDKAKASETDIVVADANASEPVKPNVRDTSKTDVVTSKSVSQKPVSGGTAKLANVTAKDAVHAGEDIEDSANLKPLEPVKIAKPAKKSAEITSAKPVHKRRHAPEEKSDQFGDALPSVSADTHKMTKSPFQKLANSSSSSQYDLRGVSAGTAWVASPGSGTIMTVSKGDFLPGLGRVTEIRRGFSGGEVIAEKGMLRQ